MKIQDSHPHNQHIRGATVELNLYIIMYQMNGSIGEWFRTTVRVKARMSSVTHPLQHFSRTDHV